MHARKNPEVSGFIWDRVGGSINFISIITLLPGLAVLAKRAGGCYKWDCDGSDDDAMCGKRERDLWYCREEDEPEADRFALCSEADACRVYGLSPTSIISAIGTVSGLVCALLMPFVGAVVDYTSQRWQVACATAALLVGSNALQIFLSSGTWFTMVLVQSTVGVGAYMAHQACLLAYVPELSKNQADIPAITGTCKACESAAIILFLIVAIGVGGAVIPEGPSRDVQLARVGQIAAVALGGPLMALGLARYLGKRRALHALPPGEKLLTVGVRQVARTTLTLGRRFGTLGRFFAGYAFWESATSATTTLTGAYVLEQLGMDGMGFSVIALEVVVFTIPGALFSIRVAERGWLSLRASVAGALAVFTVSLLFVFAFIHTRESAPGIFAVCPFIGFSNGWIYPAQRNLLVALMPGGAETEMMGFFQFSSSIFSWAPAVLFLAMSESLGSLRYAILVCPLFWLIGLATLLIGVDVEKGVAEVADTLHLRVHQDDGAADGAADGAGSKPETELVVLSPSPLASDSPRALEAQTAVTAAEPEADA